MTSFMLKHIEFKIDVEDVHYVFKCKKHKTAKTYGSGDIVMSISHCILFINIFTNIFQFMPFNCEK